MKLRLVVGAVVGLIVALACAPAGAHATGCAAPTKTITVTSVITTPVTTTTTTPTTTTTTSTTGTTTTPVTTTTTAPTTTITTTTTTVKKKVTRPGPALHVKHAAVSFAGLFTVAGSQVTVPRRAVQITGDVRPFVTGQRLLVAEALNGRTFRRLKVDPSCVAGAGVFKLTVTAPGPGGVSIEVKHAGDRRLRGFSTRGSFITLNPSVQPGAHGKFVELVQQRLAALHLFIPQTGVYDQGTELALDAYHRLIGWGEGNLSLGPATVADLLDGKGAFHVKYPNQGEHAEGDLSDQVLAFIDGSQVHWIFPISSGKPSTPTILGNFQIYYKEPEYTPDGMYFSSFFHGGYAIHGYNPAPDYPASHGCMRLPIVDAIPAYGWTRIGDWVDTYYT